MDDPESYFKKVGGDNCSDEFKDLISKMLCYFPKKRTTIEQLK